MTNLELKIAKDAVTTGLITEKQFLRSTKLQEFCKRLGLFVPLFEIIFNKYARGAESRQHYLNLIVKEARASKIMNYVDNYGMDIDCSWKAQLKHVINISSEEKIKEAKKIQIQLKKYDVNFNIAHILLLLNEQLFQLEVKELKHNITSKYNLKSLMRLQSLRKSVSLNVEVQELASIFLSSDKIEQALMIKNNLSSLKVPLTHILIDKYSIEANLLCCLILSQLQFKNQRIESVWKSILLQKIYLPAGFINKVKELQDQCQKFLKWTFKMSWLSFSKDQQVDLFEYLKKIVGPKYIEQALEIKGKLKEKRIDFSPFQILVLAGMTSDKQLLESVLSVVYGVSKEQTHRILARKDLKRRKKLELQQTIEKSLDELKKEKLANKEKQQEEKHNYMPVTLTAEMNRVHEAFKRGLLNLEDVLTVITKKVMAAQSSDDKNLWDIFYERHIISKEIYKEIGKISQPKTIKIKRVDKSFDFKVMKALTAYQLISNDQLQKMLHIQNILNKLEIYFSLDQLLINSKVLSSEIVNSLVKKIKEDRKTEKISKQSFLKEHLNSLFKKFESIAQKEGKKLKYAVFFLLCSIIIAGWNFFSYGSTRKIIRTKVKKTVISGKSSQKSTQKKNERLKEAKKSKEPDKKIKKKTNTNKYVLHMHSGNKGNIYFLTLTKYKISVNNNGIIINGKFFIQPLVKEKIKLNVILLDYYKQVQLLKSSFECGSNFRFFINIATKKLNKGFYYCKVIFEPRLQNGILKKFNKNYEWYLPFAIGNEKEIKFYFNKKNKALDNLLANIYNFHKKFLLIKKNQDKKDKFRRELNALKQYYLRILENLGKIKQKYNAEQKFYKEINVLMFLAKRNLEETENWLYDRILIFPDLENFEKKYEKTKLLFAMKRKQYIIFMHNFFK